MYGDDDMAGVAEMLNVWGNLRRKLWVDAFVGAILWAILLVLMVLIAPFAAFSAVRDWFRPRTLKFRYLVADKVRPDGFVRGPTTGQSDLIQEFIEYELAIVKGRETTQARNRLISHLGHMEDELEEHRALASDIRRLWAEQERPKRREAILATLAKRARSDRETAE